MLARIQKFTTLLLLTLAVAWAAWAVGRGMPWMAGVGALLIVFSYAVFLGVEFILLWFVHGNDPAPRATPWQLLRAFCGEALTAPRVFCWSQPFRSQLYPDDLRAKGRPVVLVHGFVCNRGLWNRWIPRLRDEGVPCVAVNLEPVFGSIGDYAPLIEAAVQHAAQATGMKPVVVGHSMGGLAIRAWMAQYAGGSRVHRVITIGSPHHGTWLARFAMSRNAREMALATDWQTSLRARESISDFARYTCFYSHCDNIVFPASTAMLPGADNRHVEGIAHVHMLDHPDVFKETLAWLRASSSATAAEAVAR